MTRSRGPWLQIVTILITIVLVATMLYIRPPDEERNGNGGEPDEVPHEFWLTTLPESGGKISNDFMDPLDQILGAIDIDEEPSAGPVERNATIEALTWFRNNRPWINWGSDIGRYRGQTVTLSVSEGDGAPTVTPFGTLFVDDPYVYILNQHRDIMIFDLSSPDEPVAVGRINLLGTPLGMVVKDGHAFVLSHTDLGYQMNHTGMGWSGDDGVPTYQIRAQLCVVDLDDPTSPKLVRTIGLEGFVTAGCMVGDVLLLFGNCHEEYRQHYIDEAEDEGRVYVVDPREPADAFIADQFSFVRPITMAHVSSDSMIVVMRQDPEHHTSDTSLEMFSIDGVAVEVESMTTLETTGTVAHAHWIDVRGHVLRVASWVYTPKREMLVRTMDIGDLDDILVLSDLHVQGLKDGLMVRFDGDVLLLFHGRERDYEETDLIVVDMSDAEDLQLSGSTTLPGRYFWAEAFDGWLIATGSYEDRTDDLSIICLVELGEDGPVLRDDERFAERWSSVPADEYMEGTLLLEEEGLVFVPARWDDMEGEEKEREGVGAVTVSFDLSEGTLTAGERVGVPWSMYARPLAMSRIGDVQVCLSGHYLQFFDISDVDDVEVIDTVQLVPFVFDVRLVRDRMVWIIRAYPELDMYLWVGSQRDLELSRPDVVIPLGKYLDRWYWRGDYLLTYDLHNWPDRGGILGRFQTIDLTDPDLPSVSEPLDIELEGDDWNIIDEQNPVLVDGGLMVYLSKGTGGGKLHWIDVRDPDRPTLMMTKTIDVTAPRDMRVQGHTVYITDVEDISDIETVEGNNHLKYTLIVVDVSDPVNSTVSEPINIPGTVVGISDDGGVVYTHAFWAFETGWAVTLNAVEVSEGVATITWAVDTSADVYVKEDRAIVLGGTYHESRRLSNGEYEHIMSTTFTVLDLSRENGPRDLGSIELFGEHSVTAWVGDFIICRQYEAYYGAGGVQVVHIRSNGRPEDAGFYAAPMASFTPVNLQEGYILMASDDDGAFIIEP